MIICLFPAFLEKGIDHTSWVNGGYMVIDSQIFQVYNIQSNSFKRDVLPDLADKPLLGAYRHAGFWQCMDTPSEMEYLDWAMEPSCSTLANKKRGTKC